MTDEASPRNSGIVFDGDDLRLILDRRQGSTLLMTFTVRPNPGKELVGFAAGLAAKNGFDGIYVIAKRPHWWQTPELAQVEQIIRESGMVQEASRSLCYGASMGAHGVLLCAGRLGFDAGLLIAPQVSLSPDIVPFENRWDEDLPNIRFTEPDGRVGLNDRCAYTVVFDPRDEQDLKHVAMLPPQSNIQLMPMPFGGHTLPEFLKQTGVLSKLVVGMAQGTLDAKELRREVRRNRGRSGHYFDMMSRTMMRRGFNQHALGPARRWFDLEPESLPAFNRLTTLLRSLEKGEQVLQAAMKFTASRPDLIEGWRSLRQAAYQFEEYGLALTAARSAANFKKAGADDWRWLVRCLSRDNRPNDAVDAFRQAYAMFPDQLPLLRVGIQALVACRRHDEAELLAQKVAKDPKATDDDRKVLEKILLKKAER